MVGEDKSGGSSFTNVNCYSSTDLVQWTCLSTLFPVTFGVPVLLHLRDGGAETQSDKES